MSPNSGRDEEIKLLVKSIIEEIRSTSTKTFFGSLNLTPADIMKFGGAVLMIIVFFVNGQNDKKLMQESLAELKTTTSRLVDFKENSDGWNSQIYGTRFKDGQPMDVSFKAHNKGVVN